MILIPQDSQYKQIQTSTQVTMEVHRLSLSKDKLTTQNYKTQVGVGLLVYSKQGRLFHLIAKKSKGTKPWKHVQSEGPPKLISCLCSQGGANHSTHDSRL